MSNNHSPSDLVERDLQITHDWLEERGEQFHAASVSRAAAEIVRLRNRVEELRGALDDLQQAEAEYRLMHDRHGDGSQAAGRAWDLMRRAGDKARQALEAKPR